MDLTHATLHVRDEGAILFVRIHRPDAGNAVNSTMVRELGEVFAAASDSPTTTVVVLAGLPEVFCAGADFAVISEAARQGHDTAADPEPLFELFRLMSTGDFLTVAHVRGRANAGGVGLVAASDVVIANESASFGLSEMLFGLIPAVVLPFLIRRMGFQRAHYLAGTTYTIDARRACDWGLVDTLATDSEAALRTHLQRLGRLSKESIARYRAYLRKLNPIPAATKDLALVTNREVFKDPENMRAIRRYSEDGVFPWEEPTAGRSTPAPRPEATVDEREGAPVVRPESLGNPRFRETHGLERNYVAGAMYKGIASAELVTAMGNAGMLGFFGTGGLSPEAVGDAIAKIERGLDPGRAYGMNLLHSPQEPELEARLVELYLERGVHRVESSAYIRPSLPLVRYRLAGLSADGNVGVRQDRHIIAKVSRAEVAEKFLRPAPPELVARLLRDGLVTPEQAELAARVPLAEDICVEADSAGHTDRGNAYVLMPVMLALRDRVVAEQGYRESVRIGAAGGIGTPAAALAAFMMGAEFIVTGSINQCTVEAGTSEAVKDILQELGPHDTDYAPAGDMFEIGAKVQAVKRGLFFPARAQKLYELYLRHDALEDLDAATRTILEEKYFKRPLDAVWEETRTYLAARFPERLAEVERSPKQKMAHVFRWYFVHSTRLAMVGGADEKVDFQIHCGPAMGAFNTWVKGTPFESWRARRVDLVAEHLLRETAALLDERLARYGTAGSRTDVTTTVK